MKNYQKTNKDIVIFDIENSYMQLNLLTFSLYGNDVISPDDIVQESFIHCIGYKYLGSKQSKVISTHDDIKRFKKDHTDDFYVVNELHKVLKECKVIIGHNMNKFDWPKLNDKFIYYNLKPIDKPIVYDTLREQKKIGKRPSYKLEALCQYYARTDKEKAIFKKKHKYVGLWKDCFYGNLKATKIMAKYCKQDLILTEFLFNRQLPYVQNMPFNMNSLSDSKDLICPSCGSKEIQKNGTRVSKTGRYQRYSCGGCGTSFRGKKALKTYDGR